MIHLLHCLLLWSRNRSFRILRRFFQVRHSFLHQNNSLANHVAWFVSRAGQFLCYNRAVFYCVQEKLVPEKNLYQIDRHTRTFVVQDDLYQFLPVLLSVCRRYKSTRHDTCANKYNYVVYFPLNIFIILLITEQFSLRQSVKTDLFGQWGHGSLTHSLT